LTEPIIVAVCSAKGSPGVTTLACALGAVWPNDRQIVLAECDPSGGDIAARFGLSAKRGMTTLVVDSRHSRDEVPLDVRPHIQALPGGLEVLAGPTGAIASRTVGSELPNLLARARSSEMDLILDLGRIQPGAAGQVAALAAAGQVVVVAHRTVESVASTRWISQLLTRSEDILRSETTTGRSAKRGSKRSVSAQVGVAFSSNGLLLAEDAAIALGLDLLAIIPNDQLCAAAMRGEPVKSSRLERSALVRAARSMVDAILADHIQCAYAPDPRPFDTQASGDLSHLIAKEAAW
jgi:hypothetical protein